jgi:hypothetical protein
MGGHHLWRFRRTFCGRTDFSIITHNTILKSRPCHLGMNSEASAGWRSGGEMSAGGCRFPNQKVHGTTLHPDTCTERREFSVQLTSSESSISSCLSSTLSIIFTSFYCSE